MHVHGHDVLRHREDEPKLGETHVAHRFFDTIRAGLRQASTQNIDGEIELQDMLMQSGVLPVGETFSEAFTC